LNSRGFAQLLSFIFNPPIVAAPTFLFLIAMEKPTNPLALELITVLFGTLIPLAIVFGLSRRRIIPDIWASERETRVIPFAGAVFSYLIGAAALVFAKSPTIITSLMLCYLGNTVVMMFITLRWKISVHASGIAGPSTALVYLLGATAAPLLLLAVPVGWARIKLGAHTILQVIGGASLTFLITWIQIGVYMSIL
jgi:membrane-associated phospholipid phosphatase